MKLLHYLFQPVSMYLVFQLGIVLGMLVSIGTNNNDNRNRKINVDNLNIKPLNFERVSKPRLLVEGFKPKLLNSALVDDHDMDTLPRLRRLSSIMPPPSPQVQQIPRRRRPVQRRGSRQAAQPNEPKEKEAVPVGARKGRRSSSSRVLSKELPHIKREKTDDVSINDISIDELSAAGDVSFDSNRRRSTRLQSKPRVDFSPNVTLDDSDQDEDYVRRQPAKSPRRPKRVLDVTNRTNSLKRLFETKVAKPLKSKATNAKLSTEKNIAQKVTKSVLRVAKSKPAKSPKKTKQVVDVQTPAEPELVEENANRKQTRRKPKQKPAETEEESQEKSATELQSTRSRLRSRSSRSVRLLDTVPLTKTKQTERQKPLYIDVNRIETGTNRSGAVKPTPIDVIQHLIKTFQPPTTDSSGGSTEVNEEVVHEVFRSHIQYHLNTLLDANSSINNLSAEIAEIQKRKEDIRRQTYDIRAKHSDVGIEMNDLRNEFQSTKNQLENINKLQLKINSFKTNQNSKNDLSSSIEMSLADVNDVVNPIHGIYPKLQIVNNLLQKLESSPN